MSNIYHVWIVSQKAATETVRAFETSLAARQWMAGKYALDLFDAVAQRVRNEDAFNCCTNEAAPDWSQFKSLETGGCRDGDGVTEGGIPDEEAEFWTVYARDKDGLAEAITDCRSRKAVDEMARRLSLLSGLPVE